MQSVRGSDNTYIQVHEEEVMEEAKLKRKGALVRESGSIILVNEEDKAFGVDEVVAYIWSISDGKTVSEVIDQFSEVSNIPTEEVREPIINLINKLKSVSLLE
mgnify:CR=1 FL=1